MTKRLLIIVISSVALILLAGVAWWVFYGKSNLNGFTKNAKGLQIGATINPDGASRNISTSGGELTLDLAADSKATLSLPDKSLSSAEAVTIKKIESLNGLPKGAEFIRGVELGPDGIWLDAGGELKIPIPSDKIGKKLIGFSFATGGKDFHYYPIEIADNVAKFTLSGFSGYGILALQDENVAPSPPTEIQRQATQYIARIILEKQGTTGGLDDSQKTRIANILTGWYKASIKGNLKAAENNPDKIDSALHEFIAWRKFAQIFGVEDKLNGFVEEGLNSIAIAILNASDKAHTACVNDKDATKALKLLRYKKMTELLGLDGRAGLSEAKIDEYTKKCVSFKLTVTSKITMTAGETTNVTEASGEGAILYQDNMKLAGNAEIHTTSDQVEGMPACTSNVPEVWKMNIPEFSLATSATGPKFNLQFDMTVPDASLVWTCKFYYDIGTSTDPNPAWLFDYLHKDEITNMGEGNGETINFVLSNWEIVGKGDVFARKVYSRDIPVPAGTGNYHEETTFELIYTPQ